MQNLTADLSAKHTYEVVISLEKWGINRLRSNYSNQILSSLREIETNPDSTVYVEGLMTTTAFDVEI